MVYVINLNSEKKQIEYEEIESIHYLHIPAPLRWSVENSKQWDCYHRNVAFLLKLHIKDKKNLIFHLNNNKESALVTELKKAFDCKVILTIHYFDWCFNLFGMHISVIPTQPFRSYPPSLFPIKWHWVANL